MCIRDRDDMATMVTIAGLILALFMVMDLISDLFESVKRIFDIY